MINLKEIKKEIESTTQKFYLSNKFLKEALKEGISDLIDFNGYLTIKKEG